MTVRRKFLISATAILFVVLVAGFFCRQTLTGKLVDWRIQSNLETSREAEDAGDWKSAYRYALSAHQLGPQRLDALLALQRAGIKDRSRNRGELATVAVRVIHHPSAPLGDKAQALKLFLDAGDGVVFFRLFEKLSEDEQRNPGILRLYASYLASIGEIANSARILESLLAGSGGEDHGLALELAKVLSAGVFGNEGVSNRIQQLMVGLLNHPDRSAGLEALSLLQFVPAEQWKCTELLQAADWVDSCAQATVADRLTVWSLRIHRDSGQRASWFDQAQAQIGATHPEVVARWLLIHQEFDRALLVLNEEIARRTPEGFIARARILHQAGRMAEAEEWLQKPHQGVPPSVVSTMRAVVAEQTERDRWWQKALQQAELEAVSGAGAFWRISGSAAAAGNREIEMRAATEALKRPGAHPSVTDLGPVFAWLYENNRVEDLRQIFRLLIRREPESAILRNNLAYLEIVSGRSDDVLVEELVSLHQRFPGVSEIATSLAVAELERGNYEKARVLLQENVDDWEAASASTLAAYAVVMTQTELDTSAGVSYGNAEALRARIPWSEMLETERNFFRSRLKTAVLSSTDRTEAAASE